MRATAAAKAAHPQTGPAFGGGRGGGRPPAKGKRGKGKPELPKWRRVTKRVAFGALIGGFAVAVIGFLGLAIRYSQLQVPAPADFAAAQSSTLYYADGKTVMGRLGVADREVVTFESLPQYVPNALVASEDRSFYTNPGIDVTGTARALFKTVVLGHKQGGSTITQQYVERYYVGATTTDIKGKIDEALLALKIDSQQEKTEVLQNYMNTIYFGRGAYGIEAASRQYFDKHAADLTYSEAALLAGIVPAPSAWDPRLDRAQAEYRWNYVLDGMLKGGYITQSERNLAIFPSTIAYQSSDVYGGPKGYVLRAALVEVQAQTGITQEEIESKGYSIVTTIDVDAQQATVAAVAKMPTDHAPNLRIGAVTLDVKTGAILSMYGGADYLTIQRNAVTQDIAQAGSTFKPFALVAALEDNIALESVYDGRNKLTVSGFDKPVTNFVGESFRKIDLTTATAYSVNTVFAQLGQQVGPAAVKDVAIRAGVPENTAGLEDNAANVLGTASPHLIDMAHAYATFANEGVRTEPFLVSTVSAADGTSVYEHKVSDRAEFTADVMSDATYAMTQVVRKGSGTYARQLGRPVAGKTGTSNDNRSAWFIGFTPQVVGAVAMYQVGADGSAEPITPFGGFKQMTGGSIPVEVFTWMMAPILEPLAVENFPARSFVGVSNVPSPSPTPTPTPTPTVPSPTPTPTQTEPSPSITPTPKPTPSVVPSLPVKLPVG